MSSIRKPSPKIFNYLPYIILVVIVVYLWASTNLVTVHEKPIQQIDVALADKSNELTRGWLMHEITTKDLRYPIAKISNPNGYNAFSPSSGVNIWDMFPPLISCPDMTRVGNVGEGGKWVCGLNYLASKPQCVMYSFGVSTDVTFEIEIVKKTNCIVYAFDPTVGKLPNIPEQYQHRFIFHKMALGTTSGSTEQHSLVMQFYDIMHRYGHAYIDLLKVDIENGEWDVFAQLLALTHTSPKTHPSSSSYLKRIPAKTLKALPKVLPFGQLLIELHYRKFPEISSFFHGLLQQQFYPFSREINLIPTLQGGLPFASEYSFLNVENYYYQHHLVGNTITTNTITTNTITNISESLPVSGSIIHQERQETPSKNTKKRGRFTIPPAFTPSFHRPIDGVVYFLTKRSNRARMCAALGSFYRAFYHYFPYYRVYIFHDDYTVSDEAYIRSTQCVPVLPGGGSSNTGNTYGMYGNGNTGNGNTGSSNGNTGNSNGNSGTGNSNGNSGTGNSNGNSGNTGNGSGNTGNGNGNTGTAHTGMNARAALQYHLQFVVVNFTIPDSLLKKGIPIPDRTICDPEHSTIGYRHMCRFHAYAVHDLLYTLRHSGHPSDTTGHPSGHPVHPTGHSGHPSDTTGHPSDIPGHTPGQPFEYLWRLDDDSLFPHPIGYDVFRYMSENEKKYGFVNLVPDNPKCVLGLWQSAATFLETSPVARTFPDMVDTALLWEWEDPLVVYNNFEISHITLWTHPLWTAFRGYIEELGGIFTLRWGDAPIHTIAITFLLPKIEIHAFTDIAYTHTPFVAQTPRGLPIPHMDPFLGPEVVACDYYDHWVCRYIQQGGVAYGNLTANLSLASTGNINTIHTGISSGNTGISSGNTGNGNTGTKKGVAGGNKKQLITFDIPKRGKRYTGFNGGNPHGNTANGNGITGNGIGNDGNTGISGNGNTGNGIYGNTGISYRNDSSPRSVPRSFTTTSIGPGSGPGAINILNTLNTFHAVFFTFAHAYREDLLIDTITSFYHQYLMHHPTPVVVFYHAHSPFDLPRIQQHFQAVDGNGNTGNSNSHTGKGNGNGNTGNGNGKGDTGKKKKQSGGFFGGLFGKKRGGVPASFPLSITFVPIEKHTGEVYTGPQTGSKSGGKSGPQSGPQSGGDPTGTTGIHTGIHQEDIPVSPHRNSYCASLDPAAFDTSMFLRHTALSLLRGMGYEWFVRFGDDSQLTKPVPVNIISQMVKEGKRYGYVQSMQGREECYAPLWAFGQDICQTLVSENPYVRKSSDTTSDNSRTSLDTTRTSPDTTKTSSDTTRTSSDITRTSSDTVPPFPRCSPLFSQWTAGLYILTSFEVSHWSVWDSLICSHIFEGTGHNYPRQRDGTPLPVTPPSLTGTPLTGNSYRHALPVYQQKYYNISENWGDAALHTLCVTMSLSETDVSLVTYVPYSVTWSNKQVQLVADKRVQLDTFRTVSNESVRGLDRALSVQWIGWLGGDVASSVPLPPAPSGPLTALPQAHSQLPRQVIWLFGDTIIGTATPDRRVYSHYRMVSNSVGVMHLAPPQPQPPITSTTGTSGCPSDPLEACLGQSRTVQYMKYHWKVDHQSSDMALRPVFQVPYPHTVLCAAGEFLFVWPMTGISVYTTQPDGSVSVQLLLIGSVTCTPPIDPKTGHAEKRKKMDCMNFDERHFMVMVVSNPYEAPDFWQYTYEVFPQIPPALFRLIGVVQEEGHYYASEGDYLYLLASYQYNRDSSLAATASYQTLLRVKAKHLLHFQWARIELLVPQHTGGQSGAQSGAQSGGQWISIQDYWAGAGVTVDEALKAAKSTGVMTGHPRTSSDTSQTSTDTSRTSSDTSRTSVQTVPYKLYGPMVAEAGFYRHPVTKDWHVMSLVFTERYFQLCTTDTLKTVSTPWSCRYVYEVPGQYRQVNMVHYAAKAHPYLLERPCATPDTLRNAQALLHQSLNATRSGARSGGRSSETGPLSGALSGVVSGASSLPDMSWDMMYSFLTNAVSPYLLFEPEYRDIYLPRFVHLQKIKQQT